MTCYRPLSAWKTEEGPVVFAERGKNIVAPITLKCGQCIGCRAERVQFWAVRCVCESKMHKRNSFITLTYDDDHLPMYGSLVPSHFQGFMKRLRERLRSHVSIRFYACGEYGDSFDRPHYHALIFGYGFDDRVRANSIYAREDVYRSELLESCWPYGFSSIGEVSFASAQYVAAYATKRFTGKGASDHYSRVDTATGEIVSIEPEFGRMSLRPGIGAKWLEQFWRETYVNDSVRVNGRDFRVPRYFDNQLMHIASHVMTDVEMERLAKALQYAGDCTPERLAVREVVHASRTQFYNSMR